SFFFFSSRRRHTRSKRDWSSDVCSSDLVPNGVAFRDGALYVAETGRILRYDSIETRLQHPPKPVVVTDRLPREGHHGWRYIGFRSEERRVGKECRVRLATAH